MNSIYSTRHYLKLFRWQARRSLVALRWGPNALQQTPAVLGNAMPKSGSHLINQVLQGLTNLGPFVDSGFPPVTRDEFNEKLTDEEILANLKRMRPGDLAYGYIKAFEPFISLLTQPGRATIFVYRDPRDMIVSHVFYATDLHKGHGMHQYYTETLKTMEERINAAIQGVEESGARLSPIRTKYEGYLGWIEQSNVLCLRFEDLMLNRKIALGRVLDYLEQRGFKTSMERTSAIQFLEQAIAPKKSGTFRKGQPGNWREHFTEANKTYFKENTGDLIVRLCYEKDNNW
jgi:hypothetical protein